jgi:hypothetical protein
VLKKYTAPSPWLERVDEEKFRSLEELLQPSLTSLFIDSPTLLYIFCAAPQASLLVLAVTLTTRARLKTQQLAMFSYCTVIDYSATMALNR